MARPEPGAGSRTLLLACLLTLLGLEPLVAQGTCPLAVDPGALAPASYGPLFSALRQMRIPEVHTLGFTGAGVRIGVIDTGFEDRHESLAPLAVLARRDFIQGDTIIHDEPADTLGNADAHGTAVLSILAACAPDRLVGLAFGAEFVLAKTNVPPGTLDTRADEQRWIDAAHWVDSLDVDVVNSSLGFKFFADADDYEFAEMNGDLLPSTRTADSLAAHGVLVVTAIGNEGPNPGTIKAPADADSVLAVGAVDSSGAVIFRSSRGPTADGRIKPELSARGLNLPAADDTGLDRYHAGVTGTSFAAPLITGAVALLMEAWPALNAMAIRRALLLSGSTASRPDNNVGRGVPDVLSALSFPEGISLLRVEGAQDDGTLSTLSPVFRWDVPLVHQTARPVRYFLELATDSAFADVLYRDSVGDAFALPLRRGIRPTQRILWRVVAVGANSATRVGPIGGPLRVPSWVRLISFNSTSGNFVPSARPTFVWSALPAPAPIGPLEFELHVLDPTDGDIVQTMTTVGDTTVTLADPLVVNQAYRWRVIARTQAGVADTTESVAPFVVVSEESPPATLLYQNFPNPFPGAAPNGRTTLWFDLAERASVQLTIHDLRGRLIRRLIPGPGCGPVELDAGVYGRTMTSADPCVSTQWDGRDERGQLVPSGVYIARLRAGGREHFIRLVFLPG
ncbi:MAG: S8 family serine peptidase [Longimicrobiales bacterium]